MRRFRYALITILLALPLIGWIGLAHAQSFRSGDNVTVAAGETLNRTLFASGKTLDIAGTVNGDVFCAGQTVNVSGTVNGDVICAGQNVTVGGTVTGDIRVAGQQVVLNGKVGGNASVAAQTLTMQSGATVAGDVSTAGQDVTLNGKVGRDLATGGRTLTIAGVVGRDIRANVSTLRLDNGARVSGNLNYTSTNGLARYGDAVVAGKVTHRTPPERAHHSWVLFGWFAALYMYISFLLTALVLVLLFPRVYERAAVAARAGMGKTFLVGFVASILVPILLVALLFTVIGIPLAIMFGIAWLLAVLLAGPFAAYLFGHFLFRGAHNAILTMLAGAAILFFLFLVPFIGWIIWLVALWFGLGMLLLGSRVAGRPHYHFGPVHVPVKEK